MDIQSCFDVFKEPENFSVSTVSYFPSDLWKKKYNNTFSFQSYCQQFLSEVTPFNGLELL